MDNEEKRLEGLQFELGKAHQRIAELETLRKQYSAELDALKVNEARFRQIVQNANSIILLMDIRGNVTFLNQFGQRFFGFYEKDILGKNVIGTIVSKEDLSGNNLICMIKDIVNNPECHSVNENENIRANGERVRILWSNKAIIDDSGKIKEILCIGNDISKAARK